MPSFDVVSELDIQEVRNAIDQARREIGTRFDFKGTDTSIDLDDNSVTLHTSSEDRLAALRLVIEEKLVRRNVSLKILDPQKVEEASGARARQKINFVAGISSEKAKAINKFLKETAPKGITSQTQGEQVRVNGKKRDDLQGAIAALKEEDFGIPLQFINFRD